MKRIRKPKYKLLSAPTGPLRTQSYMPRVKFEDGMKLVMERKAECVYLGESEASFSHFVMIRPGAVPVVQVPEQPLRASSTVLSRRETEAAAGLMGASRTAGLDAEARAVRVLAGKRAMDFVEAAQVKLRAWEPVRLGA